MARRWQRALVAVLGQRALVAVLGLWAAAWLVNRSLVAVRGSSMLPTLAPGQRLLTVPTSWSPARVGRVVVVEDPLDAGHLVIKRVARIEADGRVLVLGDNPAASTDGRRWGPIPVTCVRRVAVARWPCLSRRGLTPSRRGLMRTGG